jgi:hypothetical protein
MIQAIIKIRLKQIQRATRGLGLGRFIFLSFFMGFIVLGLLFIETSKAPNSYYTTGIYSTLLILIQINRKDKRFLRIHFNNFKWILFMEYLLLIIPLLICLIFHGQLLSIILVAILIFLIINIKYNPRRKTLNTAIQRLIPADCFEWKSGVRKTLFIIIFLWVIGMGTSFFIGSVPIIIFILGIFPLIFNGKDEPLQMILAFEMGTNRFLKHKIITQLFLFTILSFPLILSFLIFHDEFWYIPITQYVVLIFVHLYFILTKYAFYKPNQTSSPSQAFSSIGGLSILFIFLIPLVWVLSIYFYFKSRKILNFYLNDYN